jgi:putative redox protein
MTTFHFVGAQDRHLSGHLDQPDGPELAYAVFVHCFTTTEQTTAAARISRALTMRGYGVLLLDFSQHSENDVEANRHNVVAAVAALENAGKVPSLLIGHGIGGAAVLAAAGDLPKIQAVATVAAPFNADPAERIRMLRRPLLILHAPQDKTVDIDNATAIFIAARHPKSFVSLDRADHLLTRAADAAYVAEVIAAWASRYLASHVPLRNEAQEGSVVIEETGEGKFQVEIRAGGARFLADEPVEVGGLGSGPTPYDLLGAGLGACTAMTLRMYARRKELDLRRVCVTVGHRRSRDETPPDIFVRKIRLAGQLDEAQRGRLLEIADRCPVHRTLTAGAQIRTEPDQDQRLAMVERPTQHGLDAETVIAASDAE